MIGRNSFKWEGFPGINLIVAVGLNFRWTNLKLKTTRIVTFIFIDFERLLIVSKGIWFVLFSFFVNYWHKRQLTLISFWKRGAGGRWYKSLVQMVQQRRSIKMRSYL